MLHLYLLVACIVSIEIFEKLNFFQHLKALEITSRKVFSLIPNKKVSDNWKEQAIPKYALIIMKKSLSLLIVLIVIISIFLLIGMLDERIITYLFTIIGIIECMFFAIGYMYLKKFINK